MNKKGFTLLEVILFLAISSGMAAIAFIGLGPRLRNVRFTQSVRAIESTVSSELTKPSSGKNERPSTHTCTANSGYPQVTNQSPTSTGAAEACVSNGTLLVFLNNKIRSYSIVSLRGDATMPDSCSADDLQTIITCFKPTVLRGTDSGRQELPQPKDVTYGNGVLAESSINSQPLAFGVIQSPHSTERFQFFYTTSNDLWWTNNNRLSAVNSVASVDKPYVCFKLAGRSAKLLLSTSSPTPKVTYEACSV